MNGKIEAVQMDKCPDCGITQPGPASESCDNNFHRAGDGVVLRSVRE
jgi:hypothetical protein